MDVDVDDKGKAKVEETAAGKEKDEEVGLSAAQRAEGARVLFVLRLLTEFCLLYSSCLSVVLRRDWESAQGKGTGGLLHHILHQLVTYRAPGADVRAALDSWDLLKAIPPTASSFLNAICLRSSEGRKRLVTDMAKALLSIPDRGAVPATGEAVPEEGKVDTLIGLALNLLSAGPTASTAGPSFSAETLKTTVEAGMVQSLTHVLTNVDLDHPRASTLVSKILKALEALTRVSPSIAAHAPASRIAHGRADTSARTEGVGSQSEAPAAAAGGETEAGEARPSQGGEVGGAPTGGQPAVEEERPPHDEEQDRMDHDRLNRHLQVGYPYSTRLSIGFSSELSHPVVAHSLWYSPSWDFPSSDILLELWPEEFGLHGDPSYAWLRSNLIKGITFRYTVQSISRIATCPAIGYTILP